VDLLTDILRVLELRGTLYFQAEFRAPWGMDIAGGEFANFHLVTAGRCWLRVGGETVELGPGDVAMLPHGDRHALLHAPDGRPVPAPEVLAAERREAGGPVYGGGGPGTTLICGHFELDRAGAHPLFAGLPALLRLEAAAGARAAWVATATRLAAAESRASEPGSTAVVDRLAELLLIQLLRAALDAGSLPDSFLAALADPELQPSLEAIHANPAHPWTLESLSRAACMSRSKFAERFRRATGLAPIQYLTLWRMQRARRRLQTFPEESVVSIAESVGYRSEFAFAKAFKRTFGQGPGAARRRALG